MDSSSSTSGGVAADCPTGRWDGIDGIIVINMDTRPDRWETFMQCTGRFLPLDKLHRLSAVVGAELPGFGKAPWFTARTAERARFWAGAAGCALSHRRAIETARNKEWRRVFVLEDDAELHPVPGSAPLLAYALSHLGERELLYLGHNLPVPYGRKLAQDASGCSWWQIEGALATHAYVVTSGLYEELLTQLPEEKNVWEWIARYKAVDVFYRERLAARPGVRISALYPLLYWQGTGVSDIGGHAVDGRDYTCQDRPRPYGTWKGRLHQLCTPIRRLKTRLNSLRTLIRARRGGLPGKRKRRSPDRP